MFTKTGFYGNRAYDCDIYLVTYFHSQRLKEASHSELGSTVPRSVDDTYLSRVARHDNYLPMSFLQVRERISCRVHITKEVCIHELMKDLHVRDVLE